MPSVREALGVNEDWYEWMLEGTDGLCEICGGQERTKGRSLAVDHDHQTGTVRGLLCTRCNRKLGALRGREGIEWLESAAKYLERAERVFGDCCEKCGKVQTPNRILETDGKSTRFQYKCHDCGVRWMCSWKTHGIPLAWRIGA